MRSTQIICTTNISPGRGDKFVIGSLYECCLRQFPNYKLAVIIGRQQILIKSDQYSVLGKLGEPRIVVRLGKPKLGLDELKLSLTSRNGTRQAQNWSWQGKIGLGESKLCSASRNPGSQIETRARSLKLRLGKPKLGLAAREFKFSALARCSGSSTGSRDVSPYPTLSRIKFCVILIELTSGDLQSSICVSLLCLGVLDTLKESIDVESCIWVNCNFQNQSENIFESNQKLKACHLPR